MTVRVKTSFHSNLLDSDFCTLVFEHLRDTIVWEDGITSRIQGYTRKAKGIEFGEDYLVDHIIATTLAKLGITDTAIYGIYLNYYRNGNDFTPNHSHTDTRQLIISLGATRTLNIAKKSYVMKNGDVAIFGSAIHGIPKDSTCSEARISIALFLGK